MKIECRYGQVYYTDLHPGEMIPDGCGNYIELTEHDIDEYGRLKNNIKLTNSLANEYYDDLSKKFEQETNEQMQYLFKTALALSAFSTAYKNTLKKKENKNVQQTKNKN